MLPWLGAWALLLAAGCSRELGRVTFFGPGLAETSFSVDRPTTVCFVENLEAEGPAELEGAQGDFRFELTALQQGKVVAETQCDPLRLGTSWARSRRPSSTRIGRHRHSLTEAQLVGCSVELPHPGQTALRVRFVEAKPSRVQPIHLEVVARR